MVKDLVCTRRVEVLLLGRWWSLGVGVYASEYNKGFVPYLHLGPLMVMIKFGEYAMNWYEDA